jgi:hypothetical protein
MDESGEPMKKRVVTFRALSIAGCCRLAGLAPAEAIVGAVPKARRRLILAAYLEAASGAPVFPLIVADIRGAIARGATDVAAELFILLRETLATHVSTSASLYRARRRDGAARLRRAGMRTLPFPQPAADAGAASSCVLPFCRESITGC